MTNCVLKYTGEKDGDRFWHQCTVCGNRYRSRKEHPGGMKATCDAGSKITREIGLAAPEPAGIGTELAALLKEYGITPHKSCGCEAFAARMDAWGLDGCDENRPAILKKLREGYDSAATLAKAKAGVIALAKGLPLTLEGMLEEATSRAIAKGHVAPPLKVVFWAPVFHMGGADQWIASLTKLLDRRFVWPLAVCVRNKGEINREFAARLTVPILDGEETFATAANQADAVIAWGLKDLPELAKLAGCGKPIVNVLHHPPEMDRPDLIHGGWEDTVAVNPDMARRFGATCLENGADVDRVLPLGNRLEMREALGLSPDTKLVLYLGRFTKEKNVPTLIRAIETLPENYRLLVCGPHAFRPEIWPESTRAIYHPIVDHLGDVLAAADCLALPSSYESHGLAQTEAWLAGLPVVSCEYSANMDFQRRFGELSWLCPLPLQVSDLAAKIQEACRGGPRVENAKKVATENFTATKMARRWEDYLLSRFASETAWEAHLETRD